MKTPLNNVETFNVTNTTDTNNNDVALDRLCFFYDSNDAIQDFFL